MILALLLFGGSEQNPGPVVEVEKAVSLFVVGAAGI
jgi:hypothetical protein